MATAIERRISFNGGEISPWVEPRVDLDKYRVSCREMLNVVPRVYGAAFRRWGTVYMGDVKTAGKRTRVVPFEFSATDSLVLEFGENYMRVWTTGASASQVQSGGSAYEVATPWDEDEIFELQFSGLNDVIYISHPNHQPRILTRAADDDWTLAALVPEWPAVRDENITDTTLTASAVTGTGITLTASASLFDADMVGGYWLVTERRDTPYVEMDLNTSAQGTNTAALYVLGEWSLAVNAGTTGWGTWKADVIVQRSYDKTTWETLRTVTSTKSDVQAIITGQELEPAWLRVHYQTKVGTPPLGMRAALEAVDPNHYGIVEIKGFTSDTVVTADVIWELGATTATKRWNEGAWSDYRGFPRAVTLHQQRLWFGGNSAQPQTMWGSVIDDHTNFRISAEDDMGMSLSLASDHGNAIQWMVSQEDLIVGTTGSEWVIAAGDTERVITPENAAARRSTNYGSSFLAARAVNDATLFVQRNGRRVREFVYAFERDGYVSPDLTMLAEHMPTAAMDQLDVSKSPETVLWAICDGRLLGMTYERSQEVTGWHGHETGDTSNGDGFESVAVVPTSNDEDEVWFVVNRTIDGAVARYIERWPVSQLEMLKAATIEDLVFLDSAVVYSGASTDTITGLDHLEGETVCALADGVLVEDLTVSSGEVTLPAAVTKAVVGLEFTTRLEPTYLVTNDPGTVSPAGKTQALRVVFDVWNTLGMEVQVDGGEWQEVQMREMGAAMDETPPLRTGMFERALTGQTMRQATIKVRSRQPFPMNLRAMYVQTEVNVE